MELVNKLKMLNLNKNKKNQVLLINHKLQESKNPKNNNKTNHILLLKKIYHNANKNNLLANKKY